MLPVSVTVVPSPSLPAKLKLPLLLTRPLHVTSTPAEQRLIPPSLLTEKVTETPPPLTLYEPA